MKPQQPTISGKFKQNQKTPTLLFWCLVIVNALGLRMLGKWAAQRIFHPSDQIRIQAIRSVRSFKLHAFSGFLIEFYPQERMAIRLEILKCLAVLGTPKDLNFLERISREAEGKEQLYALHAISSIDYKFVHSTFCDLGEEEVEVPVDIKSKVSLD